MPVKLKIGKSVSSAPRRDAGQPVLHEDPACCLAAGLCALPKHEEPFRIGRRIKLA
jgi:hypothetical protein